MGEVRFGGKLYKDITNIDVSGDFIQLYFSGGHHWIAYSNTDCIKLQHDDKKRVHINTLSAVGDVVFQGVITRASARSNCLMLGVLDVYRFYQENRVKEIGRGFALKKFITIANPYFKAKSNRRKVLKLSGTFNNITVSNDNVEIYLNGVVHTLIAGEIALYGYTHCLDSFKKLYLCNGFTGVPSKDRLKGKYWV